MEKTEMIKITIPLGVAPLYMHYPRECDPQDAYLEFDTETGDLTADYNSEIGNAVPMRVWHGIDRRYPITGMICGEALKRIMNDPEVLALIGRIYDGSETVWDGSNHVCRMTEDAEKAEEELTDLLESSVDPTNDLAAILEEDFFLDEIRRRVQAGTTDAEIKMIASELEEEVELEFPGRAYLDCDLESLCRAVRDEKKEEEEEEV